MISFAYYSNEYLGLPLENLRVSLSEIAREEQKEIGDLTIIFCSDNELLSLNQEYLHHDYFTDVITFDYSNLGFVAGDVFVSIDRIKDNASSESVSFEEELHRVVFHGFLHLLGYNDKVQSEMVDMRKKENVYLSKLFHVKHP